MSNLLALFGGKPLINRTFKKYNPIGAEEKAAVNQVMDSGILSQFIGAWTEDFYGGTKVREFERMCASYFGVKHVITVNSWTSGLIAAVGAIGVGPGDEVIVPTWTMCASATSVLHWNAIPVFVDIEPDYFNLNPKAVEKAITPFTKAIMAVDIFGHSADMTVLSEIARRHNLKIISDSAQSPGAFYKNKYAGTMADVGGFSLNYHKHIHTGEGGILVTNDDLIAERLQLIRNHAEAVVEGKGIEDISNMVGYNFRLGEIECAIGIEQLKKLKGAVEKKQIVARILDEGLIGLQGLKIPSVANECTHSYYIYALQIDEALLGVPRKLIASALRAEGMDGISTSYQNIHSLPIFQRKIAYGSHGFPWTSDVYKGDVRYEKGICPVAEEMNDKKFLGLAMCLFDLEEEDAHLLVDTFHKVWKNMELLRASFSKLG